MNDEPDVVLKKFKRAVTDSGSEIIFDEANKPGISNLLSIYSLFTGKDISSAEKEFGGKGYGDFKTAVGEAVAEGLIPIQKKKADYLNNKDYLIEVLKNGKDKAAYIAGKTLRKVYKKVGLLQI